MLPCKITFVVDLALVTMDMLPSVCYVSVGSARKVFREPPCRWWFNHAYSLEIHWVKVIILQQKRSVRVSALAKSSGRRNLHVTKALLDPANKEKWLEKM